MHLLVRSYTHLARENGMLNGQRNLMKHSLAWVKTRVEVKEQVENGKRCCDLVHAHPDDSTRGDHSDMVLNLGCKATVSRCVCPPSQLERVKIRDRSEFGGKRARYSCGGLTTVGEKNSNDATQRHRVITFSSLGKEQYETAK
ncbi:hypothetical protein PoB_000622300 [Plakobranchus ocellatus]|uniref:Uncharacterized protein n=1 Tax=Plakobranchus ocellatus TaxID=259542 RepID=A0AAV3YC43_9GAST|nr:hypothetical protein PoB_000622300 [Plakobranchus ocellatus]